MEYDIQAAYDLAKKAHHNQADKLGKPYFSHPEAVATIIQTSPSFLNLKNSDKTDAIIVALLHDTIEDTNITPDFLLAEGFSPKTVNRVLLLTFDKAQSREDYYRSILTDEVARAVKVADVAHNCMKSRMENLSDEQQVRLKEKYIKALSFILLASELDWFNETTNGTLSDTL